MLAEKLSRNAQSVANQRGKPLENAVIKVVDPKRSSVIGDIREE